MSASDSNHVFEWTTLGGHFLIFQPISAQAATGVYVFCAKIRAVDGRVFLKKGDLMVVR